MTFEVWCKAALSQALSEAGRLPGARAAAAEALQEARARGLRPVEMMALRARARIEVTGGDAAAAAEDYAAALALAEAMGMVPAVAELRAEQAGSLHARAYAETPP